MMDIYTVGVGPDKKTILYTFQMEKARRRAPDIYQLRLSCPQRHDLLELRRRELEFNFLKNTDLHLLYGMSAIGKSVKYLFIIEAFMRCI